MTVEVPPEEARVGDRVRLIAMTPPDKYTSRQADDEGVIDHIDGMGTLHVRWDDGATLGLIPDQDEFVVLREDEGTMAEGSLPAAAELPDDPRKHDDVPPRGAGWWPGYDGEE